MNRETALYIRDQLRQARAIALRDSEAFEEFIFVLERMGKILTRTDAGLWKFQEEIAKEAAMSPLAVDVPKSFPHLHTRFDILYNLVRTARNDALHEGAFARHLTTHAVELSIVLEDALMNDCDLASHFMVRNPVCAYPWQPLSFIRQTMLVNSYSYLPVPTQENGYILWKLISDLLLAQYLRSAASQKEFRKRIVQTLEEVVTSKGIMLLQPVICKPEDKIATVLAKSDGTPILVESTDPDQLLGILTPFDLL